MGLASHSGWLISRIKSATRSLLMSSLMALHFSLSKKHNRCFIGLDLGLICKECSTISLAMPIMSEGFQAKISYSVRWKSTSALSYFREKMDLMCILRSSMCSESRCNCFALFTGLKAMPTLFTSGAFSFIVSIISMSSWSGGSLG
jgi:hypothetical protein